MRNQFVSSLIEQAQIDDNIFLLVGDLGYGVVEPFVDLYPERFINMGVAEQNMLGVAAGLASEGARVFVYSIANFPTFRAAEQIRNDVDYHNLPVTIVTVGGGLSYGNLGYSHHAIQDYGLMRLFPNMEICAPGCPQEVQSCMNYIRKSSAPSYLRLAKAGEPIICKEAELTGGQIYLQNDLAGGSDNLVLTTGNNLRLILEALGEAGLLSKWNVATLPLWGMKFKQALKEQLLPYQNIVTVEDHIADGGFGSYVREAINQEKRIETLHLNPESIGAVGNEAYLRDLGALTIKVSWTSC